MALDQETKKKLWQAADKLRNNMDPSEYKHIVLGLIFLKYISDRFEYKRKQLVKENKDKEEDKYVGDNIFLVPENSRWEYILLKVKDRKIGEIIDKATNWGRI